MSLVKILQGCFLLCVVCTILYVFTMIDWTNSTNPKTKIQRGTYNIHRNRTYILAWTHPWNVPTEGFSEGESNGQCVVTYNRSRLPDASAVLFHYTSLNKENMPWQHYRDGDQVFVLGLRESPPFVALSHRRPIGMDKFNNFINWTMGYRTDNDIWRPYSRRGSLMKHSFYTNEKLNDIIAKKKNMALWVVSNCDYIAGAKRRMLYVDELVESGLKVDRFGKCFNNKEELNRMAKEKLESYKFYLAFENAYHCKDYVTEKFWYKGLYSNRVPVVFGAKYEEVKRIAPPGSFIHTEEYPSVKTLVEYLLYLDKNDTAYREYFNWKIPPYNRDDEMLKLLKLHERTGLDLLCDRLMNNSVHKSIEKMGMFYYEKENKSCFL